MTPITREQTAFIMYRYAKYARPDRKIRGKLKYGDKRDIADYAEDAVLWVATHNLMDVNDEGNFEPKRNTTRAEAVSVFMITYRGRVNKSDLRSAPLPVRFSYKSLHTR